MVNPFLVFALACVLALVFVFLCYVLYACACSTAITSLEWHSSPEAALAPVVTATGPTRRNAQPGSPAAQAPEPVVVEKPQLGYFLYSAAAAAEGGGGVRGASEKVCLICLNALEDGKECTEVPACGHVYCRECIATWMRSRNTCPLCRVLIMPGSVPLLAADDIRMYRDIF
ncbi:E3 ubiquitin-protein ligase EL5-like [Triticum dicoccoides]|uniref:E3 ubiquitin-protein ligase EL5-like n=1 Tax=Triticum dicoccoides TaxID=85692 RepID=UPI00188F35A1|nr:E3 ubiquitin-protein ligase EL5-like [Triticum dicoccoides]